MKQPVFTALTISLFTGIYYLRGGAENRVVLGVVIFSGVISATVFTLIIVPAMYHLLARHTQSRNSVERQLERFKEAAGFGQG